MRTARSLSASNPGGHADTGGRGRVVGGPSRRRRPRRAAAAAAGSVLGGCGGERPTKRSEASSLARAPTSFASYVVLSASVIFASCRRNGEMGNHMSVKAGASFTPTTSVPFPRKHRPGSRISDLSRARAWASRMTWKLVTTWPWASHTIPDLRAGRETREQTESPHHASESSEGERENDATAASVGRRQGDTSGCSAEGRCGCVGARVRSGCAHPAPCGISVTSIVSILTDRADVTMLTTAGLHLR